MFLLFALLVAQPLALEAAHLFDARKGTLVSPGLVVVDGERIAQVGGTPPAGARVVDLGDATLLPGLMDAHTHLPSEASANYFRDQMDDRLRFPAEKAQYGAEYARRTLEAGFTSVRDLGDFNSGDFIEVGLRNAIDAGAIPGPRMLIAVNQIGSRGGHADLDPFPPDHVPPEAHESGICAGPESCRDAVRWAVKYGADVIKFMASGGVLSLADPVDNAQLTQEEMNAIVDEAHRWGRKAAAHCHGDTAAKLAVAAGVDSIEHGSFLERDTLALMKKKGTFLVPGPVHDPAPDESRIASFPPSIQAKLRASGKAWPEMMRNAIRLGVKIAFGTDAGVGEHGKTNPQQLAWLVHWGMKPAQVLQAATVVDADLFGVDDRGALEKGLLADVIAVKGNPLQDIEAVKHVTFVMKGGAIVRQGDPPPEPKALVLKAARMFDAERGAIVTPGLVVISGNRIVQGPPPAGAQVIDAGDATLLPGLIDAHVHLTGEASDDYAKDFVTELMKFPTETTLEARVFAARTLRAGITTVRNVGARERTDVALKRAIDAGLAEGPRMLVSGYPIGTHGGHADSPPAPREHLVPSGVEQGICSGADQCRDAVRWQLKYGADLIKLMPSGGVLSLSDPVDVPQLTPDETAAIVDEAHAWHRKAAAHCHGDAAAQIAVAAGVDSIEHGSFLQPPTLAEMARRGTVLIPTASALDVVTRKAGEGKLPPVVAEKAVAAGKAFGEMMRNALRLGVTIGMGTDSGVGRHGQNAHELALLVKYGMPPARALQAATVVDAKLLGLSDVGSLTPGKLADVIAVPGDVLQDITAVERVSLVVKDGKVVKR